MLSLAFPWYEKRIFRNETLLHEYCWCGNSIVLRMYDEKGYTDEAMMDLVEHFKDKRSHGDGTILWHEFIDRTYEFEQESLRFSEWKQWLASRMLEWEFV